MKPPKNLSEQEIKELKDAPVKEYVIGRRYHTSWAKNRGYNWELVSFCTVRNKAWMQTPKTKKPLETRLDSLRNVNKHLGK